MKLWLGGHMAPMAALLNESFDLGLQFKGGLPTITREKKKKMREKYCLFHTLMNFSSKYQRTSLAC